MTEKVARWQFEKDIMNKGMIFFFLLEIDYFFHIVYSDYSFFSLYSSQILPTLPPI